MFIRIEYDMLFDSDFEPYRIVSYESGAGNIIKKYQTSAINSSPMPALVAWFYSFKHEYRRGNQLAGIMTDIIEARYNCMRSYPDANFERYYKCLRNKMRQLSFTGKIN